MKGIDYIRLGVLYSLMTGISEFVFHYPFSAFGLSLGIILCGLIILLIETNRGER